MACHRHALNAVPVEFELVLSTIWRKCYICSSQLLIMQSSIASLWRSALVLCCWPRYHSVCCLVSCWHCSATAWSSTHRPTQLCALSPLALYVHWHILYLCTVNRLMDKTSHVTFRMFVNFSVCLLLCLLPSISCLKIQSFFFSACYEQRWSWSADSLGILADNKEVVAGDGSNSKQIYIYNCHRQKG